MADVVSPETEKTIAAPAYRAWLTEAAALLLFFVVALAVGHESSVWLPALGIGLALVSWFGFWSLPFLMAGLFLARLVTHASPPLPHPVWLIVWDSVLLTAQIGVSWWLYAVKAKGSRWLDDPRSATVFMLIVPGAVTTVAACVQALAWKTAGVPAGADYWQLAGTLGVSHALGLLTIAPALLVVITPLLVRAAFIQVPAEDHPLRRPTAREGTAGDVVELTGLTVGNAILALVLVHLKVDRDIPGWTLWGISLLFVVWSSLRQGLRGGLITATVGALSALIFATLRGADAEDFNPLQGNLLAQTSTALLVGASSGWIRASEARYRRIIGHIPIILYSVRLPRRLPPLPNDGRKPGSKPEIQTATRIIEQAEIILVSQACRDVFGVEPAELEGPFRRWLERIYPADREIMLAALGQLMLQAQPVRCEYRIGPPDVDSATANGVSRRFTWVRDTLAPQHGSDGQLEGWEGVVEDITEPRALSQDLRRTTAMLQALVANLPTGVVFVQGKRGQPVLVNARARQLLGQREELAAGVLQLAKLYRLHRPDGSEYPAEELPVARALFLGASCTANDIVVHRPDGRRVSLITWAAPVDLGKLGKPEAAVWVLEDMTSLQQAEMARHESETRLRAVFESMGEGLVVQDQNGAILECNPAACAILGAAATQLAGRPWLDADQTYLRGDGTRLPPEEYPDRLALAAGRPVRACVVGIPNGDGIRWLQVNSVPLPPGSGRRSGNRHARLVTTFVDVTAHRQVQDDMQRAQRLELMGRLATGTVHDFNNLLTALLGMAAIARGGLPPEHPVREDLNRIIDIGEQASNLAGQLLAFSKLRRIVPRPVDLNTIVVYTLAILKGIMPETIHVETDLAAGDLWVLADDTQLKQIFMNLCLNARDAMRQGGALRIRTARLRDADASWIACAVEDTGAGMDEATRVRIFEPFFSTKERGTGLGLAVVHQIVQDLGGVIEVRSTPGAGSVFEIRLRECAPPTPEWSV